MMNSADKVLCDIYKTDKKQEMYLYVAREDGLERLPKPLLQQFGEPILVTTMVLTENKKLARADVRQVMSEIAGKGFYLQLPPSPYEQREPQ